MKKSLLFLAMAILLLGLSQQFDGQETTPTHRQLLPGSKSAMERQPYMSQARFFSRQSPDRWTTDHTLAYQQRITNLMGQQDLRVNTAPTGGAFMQHELSAGVDTAWVRRYASGLCPDDRANAVAVDSLGNVYVTGSCTRYPSGVDYLTMKYDPSGAQIWSARYNEPGNYFDEATTLAVDASGNVYVTGWSERSGTWYDIATVKYNSAGAEQWVARYNGPGISEPYDLGAIALAVDVSGNVYVTGVSLGSDTRRDFATVKYNSAGVEQWVARYNGPGNDYDWANALAVDDSCNVYVTGVSVGSDTRGDFATIKYNSAGVEQWIARYNGPGNSNDGASALAVDASGNVYVTGKSEGSGTSSDFATVKYNSEGVEQWVTRYNGPGNSGDEATAMAVDDSGNVYVTGGTGDDFATVKYNSAGVEQWVARYNGLVNSYDRASALAIDVSKNIYVTGSSEGSGTWNDYTTIKYNSEGVELWVARYNGTANSYAYDHANALAVDDSGNVYVTGQSRNLDMSYDYATVKYNSDGIEQWVARYNGSGNDDDYAYALAVDGSGNVYVTGRSDGLGTETDFATVKYNSAGAEQWVRRYNGPGNSYDGASALVIDAFDNVYVTGTSPSSNTRADFATIKYNSAGIVQWIARYNGPVGYGDDYAHHLAVDASGNVYVTGESASSISYPSDYDFATVKYNPAGVMQWAARYNGSGNDDDYAYALAVDASGNIYVTGRSDGLGTETDFATVKYNSAGAEQWVARYNGPGNSYDGTSALVIDVSGNVYVSGTSRGNGWSVYTTIKYIQTPVSVEQEEPGKPNSYWLAQNYPNPFNPATTIEFALPKSAFVTLKVYNLLGEEVATLIAEQREAGIHKISWDARGLASGVYLYRLEAGTFVQSKKLILMR